MVHVGVHGLKVQEVIYLLNGLETWKLFLLDPEVDEIVTQNSKKLPKTILNPKPEP